MEDKEIPYFVQIRGCINCGASKMYKEKTGNDYGFDHQLMAGCLLRGCMNYGIFLAKPFFDPEEIVRIANKQDLSTEQRENVLKSLLNIKNQFESCYDKMGICLDDLIKELNPD